MTKISKIKVQGVTHEIKDNEAYVKPASGIPASDIASGVIPDVSAFITKSVKDLTNYYTKSQTYTQTEVNNLIGAINQFKYEIEASTSAVTSPQSNVLYLIGPAGSGADKYEEYVYPDSTTGWVKIGDTSIDLSGYVTTQALNTALADYTLSINIPVEKGTGINSVQQKGTGAIASGTSAFAEGGDNLQGNEPGEGEELLYSKAEGYGSHAEGAAHAIGRYSHAEGGGDSIVEGKKTVPTAEGAYSHAEGSHTYAKGSRSHAEGLLTEALGDSSHAEGKDTQANELASHAEGYNTIARGRYSHAEGYGTEANAYSHAEGGNTQASGRYSHVEGSRTIAKGDYTHAEGNHTMTSNIAEHVEGQYNKSNKASNTYGDAGNTQHSVGIGTTTNDRKNAHEIMQNGDHYIYGIGGYDGTNPGIARRIQDALMQCTGVKNIISLTKAEYDALANKDSETIYVVEIPALLSAGTIAYYSGGKIKFCTSDAWTPSLGTPVAVVVVPNNHTPDGTVRCMAVTGVNANGSSATTNVGIKWGPTGTDTGLPNLDKVPNYNNTVGGTINAEKYSYLSSNNDNGMFSSLTDCLDSNLHYSDNAYGEDLYLPNPYLPDGSPNPDFRNTSIVTDNACADFNGASNTSVLVGLGSNYSAANACHKYSADGISAGNWYLPACGELAYIMSRFNQIQNALVAVSGVQLDAFGDYWSSSESSSMLACFVSAYAGTVGVGSKDDASSYVRCFCALSAPVQDINLYKGSAPINKAHVNNNTLYL